MEGVLANFAEDHAGNGDGAGNEEDQACFIGSHDLETRKEKAKTSDNVVREKNLDRTDIV